MSSVWFIMSSVQTEVTAGLIYWTGVPKRSQHRVYRSWSHLGGILNVLYWNHKQHVFDIWQLLSVIHGGQTANIKINTLINQYVIKCVILLRLYLFIFGLGLGIFYYMNIFHFTRSSMLHVKSYLMQFNTVFLKYWVHGNKWNNSAWLKWIDTDLNVNLISLLH